MQEEEGQETEENEECDEECGEGEGESESESESEVWFYLDIPLNNIDTVCGFLSPLHQAHAALRVENDSPDLYFM